MKENTIRLRALLNLFLSQYYNTKNPVIPYSRIEELYEDEEFIDPSNTKNANDKLITRDLYVLIEFDIIYQMKDDNDETIIGKSAYKGKDCILEGDRQIQIDKLKNNFKDINELDNLVDVFLAVITIRNSGVDLEIINQIIDTIRAMDPEDKLDIGPIMSRYMSERGDEDRSSKISIKAEDKEIIEKIAKDEGKNIQDVLHEILKDSEGFKKNKSEKAKSENIPSNFEDFPDNLFELDL